MWNIRLKLITKDVYIYGCSFGTKFMFLLYSEKNFKIQRNIFLFRGNFIIFRETFSYSEEVLYSVNFFVFQKFSYSKKFDNVQWKFCYIQINFSYSEKILYLKKLFTFRENFYVQRKCAYSEKTTNLNFKLFEMQLQDFGRYTWYKERKLKQ